MYKLTVPAFLLASATVAAADTRPEAAAPPKTTIVLVHGAFADGSSWDKVAPQLEAKGYLVVAVHQPLSSLADDVAAARRAIELAPGPVLLVGHSYGGMVITEVGTTDKVIGLVYVAAFAPDNGESIGGMFKGQPAPEWTKTAKYDSGGFAWLPRATVATLFAQDLPAADISLITGKQGPTSMTIFDGTITTAAWHKKPAWFILTEQDRMIPPPAQEMMSKRAGAKVTKLRSSHVPMLSRPKDVAAVILKAAAATAATTTAAAK
jgi:pimeloyl-ACP methyl ester carboxylesterase